MFFVDNDQREVRHRREDRGARADDDARLSTLMRCHCSARSSSDKGGVQDGDFVTEDAMQIAAAAGVSPISGTSRIAERPASRTAHRRKINGGLARTGHAVKQRHRKFLGIHASSNICRARHLLRGVRDRIRRPRRRAGDVKVGRLFNDLHEAALYQRFNVVRGTVEQMQVLDSSASAATASADQDRSAGSR